MRGCACGDACGAGVTLRAAARPDRTAVAPRAQGNLAYMRITKTIKQCSEPIALLRDGDIIEIDAISGTVNHQIGDAELEKRQKDWCPRKTNLGSGALWKYAQMVGPAVNGAVTRFE